MKDAIADRHGIKRPAVGVVRYCSKAHKRGSRGKNIRKSNTETGVSSDDNSDTETSYSSSSQPGNSGLPGEDASVSRSKMSDYPSSLDVEGDNDTSLYGEDVSTLKLSDHEKLLDLDAENLSSSIEVDADTGRSLYGANDVPTPNPPDNKTSVAMLVEYVSSSLVTTPKPPDNKTAVASPGENASSPIEVDADTDRSLYGMEDVPAPNMSANETTESAPDGQKHTLIEAEINSVASHDESTPRVVTQTQALPPADADEDSIEALPLADAQTQAVPPVDVGEDTIVVPNPPSNLTPRDCTPLYVKDYPTIKGAQYWSDEIPGPVFPVP
jgi:hypothetical protein